MSFSINKVSAVALREFKVRLRKKSFWVTLFLGPIMFSLLMIVPLWVSMETKTEKVIVVTATDSNILESLPKLNHLKYVYNDNFQLGENALTLFNADVSLVLKEGEAIYQAGMPDAVLETLLKQAVFVLAGNHNNHPVFNVSYFSESSDDSAIRTIISYALGLTVYFFIFMYGVQVMKGVVEEKTNRVMEVMLCTVKPFELLLGKVLGVSFVGLLQFFFWIVFVIVSESLVSSAFSLDAFTIENINGIQDIANREVAYEVNNYLSVLADINWPVLLISFVFYFYIGFLLYASLFAVIGAASGVDTDTQQFIFPLTVPLLGTVVVAQNIIADPAGSVAKWLSLFPFSAPIAMPLRLPFMGGLSWFYVQLSMSMVVLFVAFLVVIWIASRVYRIGVLSSGSKVGYKDLFQWFFMKN